MNNNGIKQPIFSNWYIEEEIGSGAFGTVYKIKREDFGQVYYSALKVMQIPADKSEITLLQTEGMDELSITSYFEELVQNLVNEIKILASLKGNSNIVSYEDHLIETNENGFGYTIYIRMELLEPLKNHLVDNSLSEDDVIKLGKDVCKALKICEQNNIIHRDIKPDNLFVSKSGDYKLGDFGVARTMEKTISQMSHKGTNSFMAPEVFLGAAYDKRVDIYSLGIVMYQLLNNNRGPFLPSAPNPIKFSDRELANKRRMQGEKIPPLNIKNKRLNDIILKACAFNAEDRFSDANGFMMALDNIEFEEKNKVENKEMDFDKTVSPFNKPSIFKETKEEEIDFDKTVSSHSNKSETKSSTKITKDNVKSYIEKLNPSLMKKKRVFLILTIIFLVIGWVLTMSTFMPLLMIIGIVFLFIFLNVNKRVSNIKKSIISLETEDNFMLYFNDLTNAKVNEYGIKVGNFALYNKDNAIISGKNICLVYAQSTKAFFIPITSQLIFGTTKGDLIDFGYKLSEEKKQFVIECLLRLNPDIKLGFTTENMKMIKELKQKNR